jgi:ABC-2 type transport system permease protein
MSPDRPARHGLGGRQRDPRHGPRTLHERLRSNEFQAVQFLPAVVFPPLLLCGLFVARDHMAKLLQAVADALPLTYAFDALQRATIRGTLGARGALDIAVIAVIAGSTLLALTLGAATLRRRTP